MKVITEIFEMEHQTGFNDWENNNALSRNLLTLLINMKNNFIMLWDIVDSSILLPYELFQIIDADSSFIWSSKQNPNPAHFISEKEGYWYGGKLMEIDIYYDHDIDQIYCSDSINEIHRKLKKIERRKKLEKLNENSLY